MKKLITLHKLSFPFLVLMFYFLEMNISLAIENNSSSKFESSPEKSITRSPIGDNINTDVYFFITDQLLKEKSLPAEQLKSIIAEERKIYAHNKNAAARDDMLKPRLATMGEGEMAHILVVLRDHYPGYEEITLYQQQGLELASSGRKNEISFGNKLDENYELGYLGDQPQAQVGMRKMTSTAGKEYYYIVQFINYNPKQKTASLSFSPASKGDRTLGYLGYIVEAGSLN